MPSSNYNVMTCGCSHIHNNVVSFDGLTHVTVPANRATQILVCHVTYLPQGQWCVSEQMTVPLEIAMEMMETMATRSLSKTQSLVRCCVRTRNCILPGTTWTHPSFPIGIPRKPSSKSPLVLPTTPASNGSSHAPPDPLEPELSVQEGMS